LDKLSRRKTPNNESQVRSRVGSAISRSMLNSAKLKRKLNDKTKGNQSSIKTELLMSKINEFNEIQNRIAKLENNLKNRCD